MQKNNFKYANIILAKPDIKILNLDKVTIETMKELVNDARKYTNINDRSIPIDVKSCWNLITSLLKSYSEPRKKYLYAVQNFFFRVRHRYDAILDNSFVINDNPGQIVFLTPGSFIVEETIPLRFDQSGTSVRNRT